MQDYLERRWGQNTIIMAQMKELVQEEVSRIWKAGKEKFEKKVNFLERNLRRKRQDLQLDEKEWRLALGTETDISRGSRWMKEGTCMKCPWCTRMLT